MGSIKKKIYYYAKKAVKISERDFVFSIFPRKATFNNENMKVSRGPVAKYMTEEEEEEEKDNLEDSGEGGPKKRYLQFNLFI